MRNMAGWLIDQCISSENLGGFATYGLANAEDYITGPTVRHEDEWRKRTKIILLGAAQFMLTYAPKPHRQPFSAYRCGTMMTDTTIRAGIQVVWMWMCQKTSLPV